MNKIMIMDRDGWRKEVAVQKSIVYIGSDPANDVVLDTLRGAGVAARHLQLLSLGTGGQGYRVVNLGTSDISVGVGRSLSPYSSTTVTNGTSIKVGDYTLTLSGLDAAVSPASIATPSAAAAGVAAASFSASSVSGGAAPAPAMAAAAPAPAGAAAPAPAVAAAPAPDDTTASESIGLRLNMPDEPLTPDHPLEGTIVVKNQGAKPGAQFKLQVEGIDPTMYEIGPGPILFPNAEKEVVFRVMHSRKASPPAGECRIIVRAVAPDAYPRETATATHTITVQPYYSHKLHLSSAG